MDSDALKEKKDIERIIENHKDKYRLVFIEKGTFEDIFDLDITIDILNALYPEGDQIIRPDFDDSKNFLASSKKILHLKKLAKFDKVSFARAISIKIDIEKIPKEINEIIEIAKTFTKSTKFIQK